jgi:hypothetical protein
MRLKDRACITGDQNQPEPDCGGEVWLSGTFRGMKEHVKEEGFWGQAGWFCVKWEEPGHGAQDKRASRGG